MQRGHEIRVQKATETVGRGYMIQSDRVIRGSRGVKVVSRPRDRQNGFSMRVKGVYFLECVLIQLPNDDLTVGTTLHDEFKD